MMKVINITELFGSMSDNDKQNVQNAIDMIQTMNINEEHLISSVVSLHENELDISMINTLPPIYTGLLGMLLYKQFVQYYKENEKLESEAMRDVVLLYNSLTIHE